MQAIAKFAAVKWSHILSLALATLVLGNICYKFLLPQHFQSHHLRTAAALFVGLRLLAELPGGWGRMKHARGAGGSAGEQLMALVPQGPLGLLRFAVLQLAGCVAWIVRRSPSPPSPTGVRFDFYGKSQYPTAFAFVMLSCAIEIPMGTVILHAMEKDPARRENMHLFVLALLVIVVGWMLGDRHWLRSTAHVLQKEALRLRLGARLDAVIPLTAIKDAYLVQSRKEMSQSTSSWLRAIGYDPDTTLIASPFDQPNMVLVLDPSIPVSIHRFAIARTGISHLLLFVADPSALVEALRTARVDLTASPTALAAPTAPSPLPDTSAAAESSTSPM